MKQTNIPDMIQVLDTTTLENLYTLAHESYSGYMHDELYSLLSEEVSFPLSAIKATNNAVQMRYESTDAESLLIGIRLSLWSETGKELGYYELILDAEYQVKDDFLVFN